MKHPVVVAQFNVSSSWLAWTSYGAGVWYVNFEGEFPLIDPELTVDFPVKNFSADIGAVTYNNEELIQAESITEILITPSFYWQRETRTLFAHFNQFNPPNSSVRIGILYSVAPEFVDGLEGTLFLPRLKSLPPLSQDKDRLFFKRLAVSSWTMVLDNGDLFFDGMPDWGVYNQRVSYFIGEQGASFRTFTPIKTGRILDFSFTDGEVSVRVQDARAQLRLRAPLSTIEQLQFPEAAENIIGAFKPFAFGKLFDVSPICVNSGDVAGPYVFLLADEAYGKLHAVSSIRVDGSEVVPIEADLDRGLFSLSAAQVKDGNRFKAVRVDLEGYENADGSLMENPLDIAEWLIRNVAGVPYSDKTFSSMEWSRERANKPSVAFFISQPTQVLSIIERLMEATRGGFLVDVDGKFTWRTPNYSARPKWSVTDEDWLYAPSVVFDTSEVIASARVGYRPSQSEGVYRYVRNVEYASSVYENYKILDEEDFELCLTNEEDAASFARELMKLSSAPAIIVTGRVSSSFNKMQIGQNAQVSVNRLIKGAFSAWLGNKQGEIISVAVDAERCEVEFSVRIVEEIPSYLISNEAAAVYGLGVYSVSCYGRT